MMKKFEEYLKERIKVLNDQNESYRKQIKRDYPLDVLLKIKLTRSLISNEDTLFELELALNRFMQSVEARSVADNESQKEVFLTPDEQPYKCDEVKGCKYCPNYGYPKQIV